MKLTLGYVPLTDAAPVIAAAELGFARAEGLDLTLSREPSWATLRDRLALGHLDAAHMLAPLAIASALGLSGPQADLTVPMSLSFNGNAITLSNALWQAMAPEGLDVGTVARTFARIARERAQAGRPLTLGTVHPFSCHSYQIRLFAELGGLDLGGQVRLVVIPPPQTVDALARGIVDGFCVGAPWNTVAFAAGLGQIAALGCEIVPDCPEKVLAVPASDADYVPALVRAVAKAGRWCAEPAHHAELATLLAKRGGLATHADLVRVTLEGAVASDATGRRRVNPDYVRMDAAVQAPRASDARWLVAQMAASGQIEDAAGLGDAAAALYRADAFLLG
ncbi:CmpA/NrtA family ABC transporter substrate-binding protein [Methylorubrum zatmanii]|uniref:CmpA/NrtA family ABC transporter substrate-binding protein n=1 Tax=Methylorubrum zatmanii TaxID=29429 RepID=A0ABW1WTT7_9HYPH|nr:CmpA/NrtA family ABC transporter substrate-binding protein [Methylorubrum zatmanii]MBD8908407.1 nitrate transporter [Methylorubrum zatmanii]